MAKEKYSNPPNQSKGILEDYAVRKSQKTKESEIQDLNKSGNPLAMHSDLTFEGAGSGLPFGSFYGNHFGWSQAAAVQNTWYNINDAAIITGQLNNITHDGNGKLTILKTGKYKIDWSATWENNTVNDHIDMGIEINGTANAAGVAHEETKFANVDHAIGSACILDLTANDTIELAIRTSDNNTPTIIVDSINLACIQIGG
ncbi:hypothetical protein KAH94_05985 [bacterium]|nr:hypothetical protein [bacterium]